MRADGFSELVDQAPAAPPISGPPGRTVLAPSARRAAGVARCQLIDAANTSLNNTTNPSAESSSRTPAATIHEAQASISPAGKAARAGTMRMAAATAIATRMPPNVHRIERRPVTAGCLGRPSGIGTGRYEREPAVSTTVGLVAGWWCRRRGVDAWAGRWMPAACAARMVRSVPVTSSPSQAVWLVA